MVPLSLFPDPFDEALVALCAVAVGLALKGIRAAKVVITLFALFAIIVDFAPEVK
jgi:hypothetical protein